MKKKSPRRKWITVIHINAAVYDVNVRLLEALKIHLAQLRLQKGA